MLMQCRKGRNNEEETGKNKNLVKISSFQKTVYSVYNNNDDDDNTYITQ